MRVVQLLHALSYGDAISGEALLLKRVFAEKGFQSEIWTTVVHPKLKDEAICLDKRDPDFDSSETLLILHCSLGSPVNEIFSKSTNSCRSIIYHNLTPENWFKNCNSTVYKNLVSGKKELPDLLKTADFVLADSTYNASELSEYVKAEVLSLPLDFKKWEVSANPGIATAMKGHGGKNLLHVGRLAPNKCIEDILKVFYFYHHKINQDSRLWLIGSDVDTELYSFELRRLTDEFRLNEAVNFIGTVSDGELRSFYENSDAYLCMSEHEGFCVPLLEAMHFEVPVLAFDACAISETLGDGGILIQEKAHAQIAELVDLILSDKKISNKLISRGNKRINDFSVEKFIADVDSSLVQPFLKHKAGSRVRVSASGN